MLCSLPSGTSDRNLMSICYFFLSCSSCSVSLATWSSWFSTSGWHSVHETPAKRPASSSTSLTCSSCRGRIWLLCTQDRYVLTIYLLKHSQLWMCFEPCWCVFVILIPQTGLQIFLVVIAMLSVPVLLLGKPLYLYWLYRGGKGLRRRRVCAIRYIQNIFITST